VNPREYAVTITRRAQKELAHISAADRASIIAALRGLAVNPRPPGCQKLTDREGWRIRIGQYRAIYEIDDTTLEITVLTIGNRRDVYR